MTFISDSKLLTAGYKRWFLGVLLVVSTFNYTDRFIFALLAEEVKRDLALTDFQVGLLGGLAFAIFYSVMGVPIARLAERWSRVRILSLSVLTWSAMTAFCGLAGNFWQMLLCRIGVGVGEASFTPVSNSLVGDQFPQNKRASALSITQLGAPISALVGAALVSVVVAQWDWRAAFFAAGLPGVLIAGLVFFGLKEPSRGLADGTNDAAEALPSLGAVLKQLIHMPTARHLIIGGSVAQISFTAIGQFLSPFYIRVHELSVADAALLYGVLQAAASALGLLIAGFGTDWASDKDRRWHAWGPALGMVVAAPLYSIAFMQPTLLGTVSFLFPASIAMFFFIVPTLAMLQNIVGPRMRASTIAIYGLVSNLCGALGPAFLGLLSDVLTERRFSLADYTGTCLGDISTLPLTVQTACMDAAAGGLRWALIIGMSLFLWAALHYFLAARSLRADLYVPEGAKVSKT